MRIGLRHIRHFVAVAEELHFRRAAEQLGMAQPALSRSIRYLERELDVTLFRRSNRSVEITTAGKVFLKGCRTILNAVDRTVDDARLAHLGQLGSIRIGYTDNAITGLMPRLLKDFQTLHPKVVLKIHHDVTAAQLTKLTEQDLDVGFVTGPIGLGGFEQCLIQSERFVCVVYETHRLARRPTIRLKELAEEDFVHGLPAYWEHFYSYLIPLCRRSGFAPRIIQEAFNTASIMGLVASGMGITVLTENIRNSIGPGLVVIPIEDVQEQLQTVAVWKSDSVDGPMKHFVTFLREVAAQRAAAEGALSPR